MMESDELNMNCRHRKHQWNNREFIIDGFCLESIILLKRRLDGQCT
jgi:hypothetical protein